jgi:amylosucrase
MTTTGETSVFAGFGLPSDDAHILEQRWQRWGQDLISGIDGIYPASVVNRVQQIIAKNFAERRDVLRDRDNERLLQPDWYQLPNMIGYAMYTDRFAGDLNGVAKKIDYLNELGINYLHLMPLLQPRKGPNDGGYAVANYREVRSDLGSMKDLSSLADALHAHGISLTLDFVLNHVADQHDWAARAQSGEKKYRDYFYIYPDRVVPEQYEKSLPEVFPAFAPGNFTWDEKINGWVWTTFNSWQWDLNWSNPDVFCEMLDVVLYLANQGADCLRLDAIAFIWKKLGTDCQNQAEVHAITQALRAAAHIAAPSLILKAEAIVGPNQLVNYLGQGAHAGKVSEIAYHNSLMVQMWSAFAAQDARMMATALARFPSVPTTSAWGTYIRCHDDIGWAIDDADASAVGWNGADHRRFLSDFFIGDFPGSFSRGAAFQPNEATGDRRISGSLASLLGVERAIADKDELALEIAVARITCAYAMVYSFGGIPLLYMGDELGLTNDYSYIDVAEHADDNRWLHRPKMPWNIAATRHDTNTVAGKVFQSITHLGRVRASLPSLHAAVTTTVDVPANPSVVLFQRKHSAGFFLGVFNMSPVTQMIPAEHIFQRGILRPFDVLKEVEIKPVAGQVMLPPYAALWLINRN